MKFNEKNTRVKNNKEYKNFQGRVLNFMKIGKGSKKIIMHGGTHAREWITPITMINTVKKLVDENRAGGANAKYLDDITWYIAIRKGPCLP